VEDYSNEYKEYYGTLKNKYTKNSNQKHSRFKNIINAFVYQIIIVLILTLGAYILKISDIKNKVALTFVKENIYFKGILPPSIEKLDSVQKAYNIIKEGYDKIKVNSFQNTTD